MIKNPGVSEVLGAVFMIAVFIAGFAILGTVLFSQSSQERIPSVQFDLILGSDSKINLVHAGGDPLRTYNTEGKDAASNAEYYILIDKERKWPIKDSSEVLMKGKEEFFYVGDISDSDIEYLEVGEGFSFQPPNLPKDIDIVYKSPTGMEKIIWSGLIPRIIDFGTGGGGFETGGGRVGVNGTIRVCINEEVEFEDKSLGNVVYSDWDFDANTNPGIDRYGLYTNWTYPATGIYTVIHNIKTDEGLNFTLTKEKYIEVKPVHADFSESWNPDTCEAGDNACNYCKNAYPGKPCGREPLHVDFLDGSYCSPTSWNWNLGDVTITSDQNPSHDFIYDYDNYDSINPTLYTVRLTASNSGGDDIRTKTDEVVVLPKCFIPYADFSYDGIVDLDGNMAVDFTDLSTSYPEDIIEWVWDFGDDSDVFIGKEPPTHEYDAGIYTVKLIIKNDCGNTAEKTRKIEFPCPVLTGAIEAEPKTGASPLTVNFSDISYPRENITGWRWSFGDGTFFYTDNSSNPNPPPHTYTRVGTFYASLMVQNKCGQAFVNTSVFVVSKEASISGKIWNDRDEDQVQDINEANLSGWQVDLEERKSGGWEVINSTSTDVNGNYIFTLEGVSNSVFRIREHLPDPDTWKITYSYGTYNEEVSDNILIYDKRHYYDINFGNNDLHRSKISVPGKFYCYGGGWMDGWFYYSDLSTAAEYLDYNTSYDTSPRIVKLSPSSKLGSMTPDPAGGYPDGYTNWGNSSFILTFREYNNYLKRVGYGAYFLDWWEYPTGTNYYRGKDFPVPDNTIITADQLKLTYRWDETIHFDIDKPKEGDIIPYTSSYIIEAHFEGKGEQTGYCYLRSPVNGKLFYNSTVGEYLITNIDTRPYEGKIKLFTAEMTVKATPNYKVYTYSNASIAFEPITASITGITSEVTWPSNVKGNATVTAEIDGKWQMNESTVLYVNNEPVTSMTVVSPGIPCIVQGTFNVEPYAGQTVPVFIRVPYNPNHSDEIGSVTEIMGEYKDSPAVDITVLSKEPVHADFDAYPWEGKAPHEVAFTDLSTGGANEWLWDFKDGETSTAKNPIHFFENEGNYSVRLTVTNATPKTDEIEKYINVTGIWHNTNLLTNRVTTLPQGGIMSFISRGTNSSITVNGTQYMLSDGSEIALSLNEDITNAKIFIAGAITECNLTNASLYIDNTFIIEGPINNIRIQDFENFHSNLTLVADRSYTAWVSFQWDGEAIPISWKRKLIMNELMPTPERFVSLEMSPSQTYFDGKAGSYYFT